MANYTSAFLLSMPMLVDLNVYAIFLVHTLAPPATPSIIHEECSAVNNSVTVAWKAPNHSFIDGYVLELDDGSGGEFRVSVRLTRHHT